MPLVSGTPVAIALPSMSFSRPTPAPDPFGEDRQSGGPSDLPGFGGQPCGPTDHLDMIPGDGPAKGQPGPSQRLNLLLSYAPWHTHAWTENLPRFLEPMGVVATKVNSARQAERFVRANNVHIAVVDLSLPMEETTPAAAADAEEAGNRVLELLARLDSPPPTVVVRPPRMQRDGSREMHAALRCGAFAVVDRSAANLEMMLQLMQRCMTRYYQGRWPGAC